MEGLWITSSKYCFSFWDVSSCKYDPKYRPVYKHYLDFSVLLNVTQLFAFQVNLGEYSTKQQ